MVLKFWTKDINMSYTTKPGKGINGRVNLLSHLYGWVVCHVPVHTEKQPHPFSKYGPQIHSCSEFKKNLNSSSLNESSTGSFGSTYTKTGTIHRRLAWPLHKDDTQIHEAFHIQKTVLQWSLKNVGIHEISSRLRQKLHLTRILSCLGREGKWGIQKIVSLLWHLSFSSSILPSYLATCQWGTEGYIQAITPPPCLSSLICLISFHIFCKDEQQTNPFQCLSTAAFHLGE